MLREAVEALDPEAIVLLDNAAADALRETYADALAIIEDFDTAMLKPGLVAPVLGRRVLALDGFEASLADPAQKAAHVGVPQAVDPAGRPVLGGCRRGDVFEGGRLTRRGVFEGGGDMSATRARSAPGQLPLRGRV